MLGRRGQRELSKDDPLYYQRRGLMPEPAQTIQRTAPLRPTRSGLTQRFIKRAQVLGFTLEEIVSLLTLDERMLVPKRANSPALKLRGHRQTARRPQGDAQGADFAVARMRNRIGNGACPIFDAGG